MWKEVDSVIYYIPTDFKFNPSLAVFNFVDTLVILKKKYTTVELVYKYDTVKSRLLDITEKGASIILYQCINLNEIAHIKELFELLVKDLQIPIIAFFSTLRNKYSKPFTNVWKLIELCYFKKKSVVSKETSIFVGHKAGRITVKRKIDGSCVDRAFAFNVGITFFTPGCFFLKETMVNIWQFSDEIINQTCRRSIIDKNNRITLPIIIDELHLLPKSDIYTVIITGCPSCGKTTLAKKIRRKWDIDYKIGTVAHVTENDFSDFSKLNDTIDNYLGKKKSVICDITGNNYNITQLVKTSMVNKSPILIIEIKINQEISKLLNFIKIQTSDSYENRLYPKFVWAKYFTQHKDLAYKEVPCVKHIEYPLVINLSSEFWYEYSY